MKNTVPYEKVRDKILSTPEAKKAYEEAKKEWQLQEILLKAREHANLKQVDVARKLDISSAAIHRLENNPSKASIATIQRYLTACDANLKLDLSYN